MQRGKFHRPGDLESIDRLTFPLQDSIGSRSMEGKLQSLGGIDTFVLSFTFV